MGIDFSQESIRGRCAIIPVTDEPPTAGEVAAALGEWDRRAAEGVTSSPREHVEALLRAAHTEPECEHIATVTAPARIAIDGQTYNVPLVTSCVTCHETTIHPFTREETP